MDVIEYIFDSMPQRTDAKRSRAMTQQEVKEARAEVTRQYKAGEIDEDDWDQLMGMLSGAKTGMVGDAEGWLVWFGGRRTPIAVSAKSRSAAIAAARKKKRRGGENVVSARKASAQERKTASKGWIRTGPNGEAPGKSKLRGYGPKPKGV